MISEESSGVICRRCGAPLRGGEPVRGHCLACLLEANGIKTSENVFCTLTASRLLTAGLRDSNDLGAVLKRHLGLELSKELGASDWGGLFVTTEQLEYCRNDVAHLHALQRALQAKLANPSNDGGDGVEGADLTRVATLEMSLIPLVVDTRLRGIKIDRARLEQILRTYEGHKKELAAELRTEFQAPKLNFASPKQLLHALKTLGLELSDTSKETLSAVVDPLAGRILRYRELAGLCTTLKSWLEGLATIVSIRRLTPWAPTLAAFPARNQTCWRCLVIRRYVLVSFRMIPSTF
jgi:DNA polymerase I-like protein with 3'-5' exonuclease and polymerase domains